MFENCSSLLYLPDISKWNISNVTNMDYLFSDCISLSKLPDISIWKTENLIYMEKIFYNCSVMQLPDISKWNLTKVKNLNENFGSYNYGNNSESLSSSFKKSSSIQSLYFLSDEDEKKRKIEEYNNINEVEFNPELNDLDDYYDNFFN